MTLDLDDIERKAERVRGALAQIPGCRPDECCCCASIKLTMIARIRRLETELARASGIAKAHGEDAYAEDFMRVAQGRDDFDEQVNAKP